MSLALILQMVSFCLVLDSTWYTSQLHRAFHLIVSVVLACLTDELGRCMFWGGGRGRTEISAQTKHNLLIFGGCIRSMGAFARINLL